MSDKPAFDLPPPVVVVKISNPFGISLLKPGLSFLSLQDSIDREITCGKSHASLVLCVNSTSYCGFSDNSDQQAKQIQEVVLVDYYCSAGILDQIALVKDIHAVIKNSFVEPKPIKVMIHENVKMDMDDVALGASKY